jgi:hypothetical protein
MKHNIQSFNLLFITDDRVKHPNLPANLPAFPEKDMRNARATQAHSWPSQVPPSYRTDHPAINKREPATCTSTFITV